MSDLLSLGLTGLKASTKALNTVSDNIANAQTPGYARRSTLMVEAMPGGDSPLYRTQVTPSGVEVSGITRATNEFLIEDSRVAASEAGQSGARLQWLSVVESGLDDSVGGVGASLTRLFNSADQLATNPANTALRTTLLQNVDDVASAMRRAAASLETTATAVATEATTQIGSLNGDLTALKRVNEGLIRARPGSTNQNTLLDERDRILDRISGFASVTTTIDDHGRASVSLEGPGGAVLIETSTLNQVSSTTSPGGVLSFSVNGSPASVSGGSLAGLAQAASHVGALSADLDTVAAQVAADFNAAHMAGFDPLGNPGQPLFSFGSGASSLAAVALTAAQVAAADSTSANGNLLSLSSLRDAGGVEANWATLVTGNASAVAAAQARDAAATSRRDGAFEARAEVSSVSLDQEAGELLRYQQAFEASARVIQVARETIQSLMNAI